MSERRTRSYSQLTDFKQCSWAFWLKRIMKVQVAPSVWLAGGQAFHTTTEQFDVMTWQENDLSGFLGDESWERTFENNLLDEIDLLREKDPDMSTWRAAGKPTKKWPSGEHTDWWMANGGGMVAKYIAWRASTVDTLKIAAVKGSAGVEVEVFTSFGGVPVRGFIDRVFEDTRTGAWLVGDLKTGRRPVTDPGQVGQYSVQLELEAEHPVTWGAYYSARAGELGEPMDLSSFTAEGLAEQYLQLEERIEAGNFEPNLTNLCNWCEVKHACRFMGGNEPKEVPA